MTSAPQDYSPKKHPKIKDLRNAHERGENVTKLLCKNNPDLSRSDIIEIAYDIQSGSYTRGALQDLEKLENYAREIYSIGGKYIQDNDVILDCGAGELTTLSALSHHLPRYTKTLACDISLSRLRVGRRFAQSMMRADIARDLTLFVADMARLPLKDSSVDIVFTSHALEPNHGQELILLSELLRIARKRLLLFEPSWENADEYARARMDNHGYIRDLPKYIQAAGGRLISAEPLPNPLNPHNPTYCYVVEGVKKSSGLKGENRTFQCPLSGYPLKKLEGFWWSLEGGWAYPEIDRIGCFREKHGVLMSHG